MTEKPSKSPLNINTPLIVGVVSVVVGALVSGLTTAYFSPNWETTARNNQWVSVAEWQGIAEKKGWILKEDCPTVPVSLNITSPGDGARLKSIIDDKNTASIINTSIVNSSKYLSTPSKVFLVAQPVNDQNLYVIDAFEDLSLEKNKNFSTHRFNREAIELPFKIDKNKNTEVKFWTFAIQEKDSIGQIYTNLQQIKGLEGLLSLSNPIKLTLIPERPSN